MTLTIVGIPNIANAQETDVKTYPFVEAIPNPVGVNQYTLINFGLLNFLAIDGDGWNVTLTIKDPNGHTETIGPKMTWSTGTVGYSFQPDTVGTYILQCHFDRVYYNSSAPTRAPAGWYAASETEEYELTVTEEPTSQYQGHSLPSEYWSRPIDSQLREWWSIAGSWVEKPNSLLAPYNDGPETAHILWNMPIGDTAGGLMGGSSGDHGYGTGDAYEGKFSSAVIIDGRLYYNVMGSPFYSTVPTQTVNCVDLHTGELVWSRQLNDANLRISFGQNLYWDCLNYRGGFSYLFAQSGSTLMAFETQTGNWVFNYTDVPSGTNYWGPNGEFLRYFITNIGNTSNPDWRLLRWNSSYVAMHGRTGMAESWGSAVQGVTFDASQGYDLNISIPASIGNVGGILYVFPSDRLIGGLVTQTGVQLWGLNLQPGHEGSVLFGPTSWTAPAVWKDLTVVGSIAQAGWCAWSCDPYVGVYWTKENRQGYAFSLETGQHMWTTDPQDYKDAWSDTVSASFGPDKIIAFDKFISASVSGIVYCYDVNTGQRLWTYEAEDPYSEAYLGNTWWLAPLFATDGKVYFGSLEHSALDPKPRGTPFFALDAETGELVFRADGLFRQTRWGGRAIIGDSIIATMDTYDQQIYGIGKGPSQTTVSAPTTAVSAGTSIIIQGTVTDVAPGTNDDSIKMRFPNGVAAVADECQSEWMLYVYKQFEQPTVTGVPVSIDAVDPNGNYIHLGDTTSDSSGLFSFVYTPENEGAYTIYATFGGSAAYYSSYDQTAMVVQAAASTPEPVNQQSTIEQYFIPAVAAIIAVVVIIGLLLALLLLKKRP
jgi:outer membrane protein assembly factor BamB/F0F1-type ATP synthase membrane subunit c/vacuolar-type H+-ATPase subunit K